MVYVGQAHSSVAPVTPPRRRVTVKDALIGVRQFVEDKLTVDKSSPQSSHEVDVFPGQENDQSRLSAYGPDFLEHVAESHLSDRRVRAGGRNIKIITGPKAVKLYKNYYG